MHRYLVVITMAIVFPPSLLRLIEGLGALNEDRDSGYYRIAENFQGRKPSQILWFCGCSRKFSLQNLGVWHLLAWHKRAIRESFLCKNHIFHQFVKVFSLESLPLYGTKYGISYFTHYHAQLHRFVV